MPSFLSNTFSSFFNRILQFGHAGNTGTPTATTNIQAGDGVATSMNASDDVFSVQPQNDDTTGTMLVKNQSGSNIMVVDTTNSTVLSGASQVNATTLFKEMGLYEFSPNTAGYHYPLKANTMFSDAESLTYDNDWGNGTDPTTSLTLGSMTDIENAVAVYWYLENNITLDSVRFMAVADGTVDLNFHLFAYTLDTSSSYGNLADGTVHANGTVSAIATGLKTGTFTLDEADINAGKVVIGFVENATDTNDFSISFNIQYHIR